MKPMHRSLLATAVLCITFAAPALAEMTNCIVTADGIRLRKSPSKKAPVIGVLKKGDHVTTAGKCAGGWVKVSSGDGQRTGYVGGWSLGEMTPKEGAVKENVTPTRSDIKKAEAEATAAVQKEVPTTEQLAIQITELRLKVLSHDRELAHLKRDIHKIKNMIGQNKAAAAPEKVNKAETAAKPAAMKK